MTTKPWAVLKSETVFDASPFLSVSREHVVTDSGKHVSDYYQIALSDFALICALTPDERTITLWQYKHGARSYGLTFPAGHLEHGEDAEEAARRELIEETGYRAGSARFIGKAVVSGNQGCGVAHLFVMRDCIKVTEPQSGDLESMDLRLMTIAEIEQAIRDHAISVLPHLALWGCAKAHNFAKE